MVFINRTWSYTPEELREKAKAASNSRTYERFLALALILEGTSPNNVAKTIGRHYQTILKWVTLYNESGLEQIYYKPPKGQKSWLNDEELEQLKDAVQKPPEQSGITGVQWTYKQVIEFCQQKFQIIIKERTAQKYLVKLGFVRKRPKQKYIRASDQKKRIYGIYS
jgi:transposase